MQTLTRAQIEEENRLLQKIVSDFRNRILPRVCTDLTEKTSDIVSKEWADAAYLVLKDLLDEQPPRQSNQDDSLMAARSALRHRLQGEIGKELPAPSPEECEEHATELAQCIVANWVTLIKLTRRNVRGALELSRNCLPANHTLEDLMQGLDGFAVDAQVAVSEFTEFVRQAAKSKLVIGTDLAVRDVQGSLVAGSQVDFDTRFSHLKEAGSENRAARKHVAPVEAARRDFESLFPSLQTYCRSFGADYPTGLSKELKRLEKFAWGSREPKTEDLYWAVIAALSAVEEATDSTEVSGETEFDGSNTDVLKLAYVVLDQLTVGATKLLGADESHPAKLSSSRVKHKFAISETDRKVTRLSKAATVYANALKYGVVTAKDLRGKKLRSGRFNPLQRIAGSEKRQQSTIGRKTIAVTRATVRSSDEV